MEPNEKDANRPQTPHLSRVLISGASGLIGRELSKRLQSAGVSVTALTRRIKGPDELHWNPEASELDPAAVSGFDAVIHLAGDPVGNGRWTQEKKRKIHDSRVKGTTLLAEALSSTRTPPRLFLCASGINYYESAGKDFLDETSPPGSGFLSRVCVDWEQAAAIVSPVSRVIALRIGVVLSEDGGTLAKMLPPFRLGLGAYVGSGNAYLSWITLTDLVNAVIHILNSEDLEGPVNLVSPEPVTGRTFANELGRSVGHPARLRIPEFLPRLILGEFARETTLSSIRAVPAKLLRDGFTFQSASIQDAFSNCITRETTTPRKTRFDWH